MSLGMPIRRLRLVGPVTAAIAIALTAGAIFASPVHAQEQEYLDNALALIADWDAAWATNGQRGTEVAEDWMAIYEDDWKESFDSSLTGMETAMAALGALSAPTGLEEIASLLSEAAAAFPEQAEAARKGREDDWDFLVGGNTMTPYYDNVGEIDDKIQEAKQLLIDAGGTIAPPSTGSAGLLAEPGVAPLAMAGLVALMLALVAGGRVATSRARR